MTKKLWRYVGGVEPVLDWLIQSAPDTARCAVVTAVAALWWPDDAVGRAAAFCRCGQMFKSTV